MRIERTGKVEPLTPRVERFLKEALRGIAVDQIQSHEEARIDFTCLGGLLAVELKTLEDAPSVRLDNLVSEFREREDWPHFIGPAPLQAALNNTTDPEGLTQQARQRIGRAAVNHLKKANRQLQAHAANYPRRNMVRMLLLLNEDHEAYDPHLVSYILWQQLRRVEEGRPLYEHVDLAVYMTERHAVMIDNSITFPTVVVEGRSVDDAPWKGEVGQLFVERWARWRGIRLVSPSETPKEFSTIDAIPEVAPRHERWRLDYRRNPYLRPLTVEQLRNRFDEIMVLTTLALIHGSPVKVSQEASMRNMELFTHMTVELGERALPASAFPHDTDRDVAAAKRIRLPEEAIAWFASGAGRT